MLLLLMFSENSLRDGFPEDAPVVMYQLRKEYPGSGGNPPHVAVETISLAIQRNECFGLLGPNGMQIYSWYIKFITSCHRLVMLDIFKGVVLLILLMYIKFCEHARMKFCCILKTLSP